MFSDKLVFPLFFLYYNVAEMGDPLDSHSGVRKLGYIYYSLAAFSSEYLSSLNNISVVFLYHSLHQLIIKINNQIIFAVLIEELIDIQNNGILLSTNITIYFILGLFIGENLGLNSVLCFVESFSANHYCRICRSPKFDHQNMYNKNLN